MAIVAKATVRAARRPGLVSAMAEVWRRPSLLALEVGWRWAVGLPLLASAAASLGHVRERAAVDLPVLQNLSVFAAAASVRSLSSVLQGLWPVARPVLLWLLPVSLLAWSFAAGLGRTIVWQRLQPGLRWRPGAVMGWAALRASMLAGLFAVWIAGVRFAARVGISGPAEHGAEPNLVLFCGIVIGATLGLFVLWCVTAWVAEAAPLVAMRGDGLGEAVHERTLRAALIETNLVMGIVRVALLILAMVFSACPLPFESVASGTFLAVWWTLVAVLWTVASDYFKVVRAAVYLGALREVTGGESGTSPDGKAAS